MGSERSWPREPAEAEALVDVPIDQIEVNPNQPRKVFDFTALDELAASIKSSGVIQPIIVRQRRRGLSAHRRRAALAGRSRRRAWIEFPAIVREATDAQSLELALVENLLARGSEPDRGGRRPTRSFSRSSAGPRKSWRSESERTARSIANSLRLLRLPEEIQADLRSGRLTMGHARALLALTTVAEQLRLRDEILAHEWSVRATEDSIRATEVAAGARGLAPRKGRRRSVELAALEEALQRGLMTRVRIIGNERRVRSRSATRRRPSSSASPSCSARSLATRSSRTIPRCMTERIVVGMSGGVDSSVAAALLVEQGYDVVGVTMRVWPRPETERRRPGASGAAAAPRRWTTRARSRATLGVPHYLLSMDEEFDQKVIDRSSTEYGTGRTPVPCVSCNSDLKFGSLLARARAWDAVAVATGHYARVARDRASGRHLLLRAARPRGRTRPTSSGRCTQAQLGGRALPGRRADQGRGAGAGAPARAGDRRQAGEPGDLLRARRRLPRLPAPPRARGVPARGDRRSDGAACSARTAASRASRSARSAGSGWRRAVRSTSSSSTPSATRSRSARRRISSAAAWWRRREFHRVRAAGVAAARRGEDSPQPARPRRRPCAPWTGTRAEVVFDAPAARREPGPVGGVVRRATSSSAAGSSRARAH